VVLKGVRALEVAARRVANLETLCASASDALEGGMDRVVALFAFAIGIVPACAEAGLETAEPPGEDAYYAVALTEGLANALQWLGGLPAPTKYCVAITGGHVEPDWVGARSPSEALLQRLNSSGAPSTFYSFTDCSLDYPSTAPGGDPAGLLWVEPLGADRQELMVGWIGFRDGTGWGCRFEEIDGAVAVEECAKWWES
jgi:hypothetical protein